MIEIVENQEQIENLYKNGSNAPYEPVNGKHFGYIGVLLSDKTSGKIQCHLCGLWKETLAFHLSRIHGITTAKYKKMFGFPKRFPLCSVKYSKSASKGGFSSIEHRRPDRFKKGMARRDEAKRIKSLKATLNSPANHNKFSLCRDQILKRVNIVANRVGHFPSQTELEIHDEKCFTGIRVRYKTWNNFKATETKEALRVHPPYTSEKILSQIKEWYVKNKRKPVKRDFIGTNGKYPTVTTIARYFGSWNRAVQMAGIGRYPI